MIDYVVEYTSDRDNWVHTTKEIGDVEEIEIVGIGRMDARIDTGNEAYNVLHVDFAQYTDDDKDMVEFSTNGEKKTLPVEELVDINIGGGNMDKRMVVKMDIILGSKKINNVKFSLSDRESNDYPVLIGKKFLQNHNYTVNVSKAHTMRESSETLNKKFARL